MAEDSTNAASAVPLALLTAVAVGFGTSFVFIVAALYCVTDIQAIIDTPTGWVLFRRSTSLSVLFDTI